MDMNIWPKGKIDCYGKSKSYRKGASLLITRREKTC